MGLLDFLSAPDTGNGVGGLLSYLQSPLYQSPLSSQSQTDDFLKALKQDPYGGSMLSPPQQSIWDQPGITYTGAPQASPFTAGVPAVAGLPNFGAQAAPQAPMAQPQMAPPAAPMPDPQASPVPVGGYQMPRAGGADLYQPQQAMLPQNATPTQGVLPQPPANGTQQQLPPALGGSQGGFLGQLSSGLQSIGNGGSILGALTGNRTDPQSIQQQNLKAQFDATRQALIDNGVEPKQAASTAMLSVLNPEAAKTVLPELLTNKQDIKMVKDEFGAEHPYWFDKINHTFEPAQTGSSSPGLQQITANIDQKRASGVTAPQELVKELPAQYQGYVNSVLAGKALPSNIGRSEMRGKIMRMAHMVDPSFDESLIPLRFKTESDYAPNGQSGRSIVALNTVQHHIGKLSDDLENLGDTGFTPLNAVRNSIAVNTGLDPKQGRAIQSVQDDLKAVTDEMSAAYKAGKVSDHEIEAWSKLANSNMPLRQLKQGIADFVGLLNGKRDQLNETHTSILGKDAPGINRDLNESITKKVQQRNAGQSAPAGLPSGWSVQVR